MENLYTLLFVILILCFFSIITSLIVLTVLQNIKENLDSVYELYNTKLKKYKNLEV